MSQGKVRSRWAGWVREALSLGVWIFIFLVFMPSFLWQPFRIPSSSMEGTLLVGDYIVVSKYAYGYSQYSLYPLPLLSFGGRVWAAEPKRGDVVVFRHPADPKGEPYIKRLVGMPGDHIQMRAGQLHINGRAADLKKSGPQPINCPFSREARQTEMLLETLPGGHSHRVADCFSETQADDTPEFVVPAGHFFMMGDNRDNSSDSRVPRLSGGMGVVPFENLVGRAEAVVLSVDTSTPWWQVWRWPGAVRWGRAFTSLR